MKNFIGFDYKILSFFAFLLLSSFFFFKCSDQVESSLIKSIDFTQVVNKYNESISKHSSKHKGIIIDGDIRIEQFKDDKNEDRKLMLFVTGKDIYRKYQFQYEMNRGEIDMPKIIANGRTIYLGDNLVIQDIEKNKNYLFIIEGSKNKISELEPTVQGIGLLSIIFSDKESLANSTGGCSCSCKKCSFCDWNCGSYEASCSCGGDSQSISCRDCYNAECTACDDPIE